MKNVKKYLLIIILIGILFFLTNPITVKAATAGANPGTNLLNRVTTGGQSIITMGQNALNARGINLPSMNLILGIAQILYFTGCVIVIALTIYKVVKFSMGEAPDKAAARKELGGWIIICIIIIAAYPLFNLIVSVFNGMSGFNGVSGIVNSLKNVSQGLTSASANSPFILILNTILRVIQVAGIGYIIIRFTVDGIRYFTTSVADRKAEAKGGIYRDLIYAVIIFGAVGFFEILYKAFNP